MCSMNQSKPELNIYYVVACLNAGDWEIITRHQLFAIWPEMGEHNSDKNCEKASEPY